MVSANFRSGVALLTLALFTGCDGCEPAEECPSDYVYANGEAITEVSVWNHAQLSSRPEDERFAGLIPYGEGGVVVGGTLDEDGYLLFSDLGGGARNSTRQESAFSDVVPVAIGSPPNTEAVFSVVRGIFAEADIERAGITASALDSSGSNPIVYARHVDVANTLTPPLDIDTTVLAETPHAAVFGDEILVFGAMQLQQPDGVSSMPFVGAFDRRTLSEFDGAGPVPAVRASLLPELASADDDSVTTFESAIADGDADALALVTIETATETISEAWVISLDDTPVRLWTSEDNPGTTAGNSRMRSLTRTAAGLFIGGTLGGEPAVLHLDNAGALVWQHVFAEGDPGFPEDHRLVVNDSAEMPGAELIVVGTLSSPGEVITSQSQRVFLARFAQATGEQIWATTYKDGMEPGDFVTGLEIHADGDTGSFWVAGETNFAHSRIRSYGGATDSYVHRFDATGREWGYRVGYCEAWLDDYGLGDPDLPIQ